MSAMLQLYYKRWLRYIDFKHGLRDEILTRTTITPRLSHKPPFSEG